jgi:TonB family protein
MYNNQILYSIKQRIFSLAFLLISTMATGQEIKCIENTSCIPETNILDGAPVLLIADKMPQYPGGMEAMYKHIAKNIRFHGSRNGLRGKMFINFVVDTTGHVQKVCIVKSCFEEGIYFIEEEVLDVFRQLAVMQPGEHKGRKVPVRFCLPIAL